MSTTTIVHLGMHSGGIQDTLRLDVERLRMDGGRGDLLLILRLVLPRGEGRVEVLWRGEGARGEARKVFAELVARLDGLSELAGPSGQEGPQEAPGAPRGSASPGEGALGAPEGSEGPARGIVAGPAPASAALAAAPVPTNAAFFADGSEDEPACGYCALAREAE